MAAAAAAAVVVMWWWWLCVVRSLLLEHTPSIPSTPNTKGKYLGQHACIGRFAQGQRGGGMRVLGVFENWAGRCVFDFDLKDQLPLWWPQTHRHRGL